MYIISFDSNSNPDKGISLHFTDEILRLRKVKHFRKVLHIFYSQWGLPRWHSGRETTCQCRRHRRRRFSPWFGKIPWRRKWQPTPVFLLGKFHWQRSLTGCSPCTTEHTHRDTHTYTRQWVVGIRGQSQVNFLCLFACILNYYASLPPFR